MYPTSSTIVFALVVLLAGCVAPLQGTSAPPDPDGANTTIDVSGTSQVSADADLAVVFVSVIERADTADDARGRAATDADRMRSALDDAGIPDDGVTTVSFRLSPRYEMTDGEREVIGYEAVHAFRVETSPSRAGEIIDVAVGNGADSVDGVTFTLTDERRAQLRDEALTGAVADARADADTVAAAADLSITGVERVSTDGGFVPYFDDAYDGTAERASGDASTTLDPGPVTVTATVGVTYTAA